MWSYNYTYPSYISHHGIKGQKWGIRRYQNEDGTLTAAGKRQLRKDNRERRKLTRRTAAAAKHLKSSVEDTDSANRRYNSAKNEYRKANAQLAVFKSGRAKKQQRIDAARDELDSASENVEKSRVNLRRANRFYNESSEALTSHVSQMMDDFGSQNVKSLQTKTVRYGEDYTRDIIKTGITVANLPVIGNSYTGSQVSKYENRIRDEKVRDRTDSRDKYDY